VVHVTRLSGDQSHLVWDNSIPAAATVGPGDVVELQLRDASGGQIRADDDESALGRLDFSTVNPCTGPVFVDGAAPGDELVVTMLDIAVDSWGWTANIPGFGLLAEDFPQPHLLVSDVSDGVVTPLPGVVISSGR
jgi:acetamidase/formamidase